MLTNQDGEVDAGTPRRHAEESGRHSDSPGIHVGSVHSKIAQFFQGNITINFNEYRELAHGLYGTVSTTATQLIQLLAEQLREADDESVTLAQALDAVAPQQIERLPYTDEAASMWFHSQLDDYERSLVRATTILHGAPIYLVHNAAETLYNALPSERRSVSLGTPLAAHQIEHLFLRAVEKDGTRRLYWQDADAYGSSAFGVRLMRLLASEVEGTAGVSAVGILRQIEAWARRDADVELSWRASRTLGAIWWLLDDARLKDVAQQWARSTRLQERRRVVGLMLGAYEIERYSGSGTRGQDAFALRLLRDLSEAVWHEPGSAAAIARTYALLGRRWPKIALDGLDSLLRLDANSRTAPSLSAPEHVTLPATQAYLQLANYGTVRFILQRLASSVEALIVPHDNRSTDQHQAALATIYFLFFLLTASSIAGADPAHDASGGVRATLGVRVAIPDVQGRDTLLAAVVAKREVALHLALRTLFAGAFLTGRASLAGEVLQQWANELGTESTPAAHIESYIDFLYRLGAELRRLDSAFGLWGFDAASTAFSIQLNRWPHWTPAGNFAERVKRELGYGEI